MPDGSKQSPELGTIECITIKNTFGNHSKIWFKSCEAGREKFQGSSLDFVWFDEEPPEDIYNECKMRVLDKNGEIVQDATVNAIHRGAHGLPMNMIFVDIVKTVYGREISLEKGQEITENLNNYIRPNYMNRKMYDKAGEYHELLHLLGVKQYILTGMENDMIEASLKNHKIETYFDGILGSQKKKTEWVEDITVQYPDKKIFATGDAMSEYKATKKPTTTFIGLDFEDRKVRIFPEEVAVATTYDSLVAKIIMLEKRKENKNALSLENITQNQR